MAPPPESSQQNLKKASSRLSRLGPYVQHKQWPDLSPKTKGSPWWEDSQTRWRMQCPRVHYHLLCTTCKTLILEFCTPDDPSVEPKLINFSTLSQAVTTPAPSCLCLQGYRMQMELKTRKSWKTWRDEQFAQVAEERRERMRVRERLRQEIQDRRMKMTKAETTTQLSTPTSPTGRSLTTHPMPKQLKATICTEPPCRLDEPTECYESGHVSFFFFHSIPLHSITCHPMTQI